MPPDEEIRRRPSATVECPRCRKQVTLYEETEEWTEDGRHYGYGPGVGECCGLAFLDDPWNGMQAFVLSENPPPAKKADVQPIDMKRRG